MKSISFQLLLLVSLLVVVCGRNLVYEEHCKTSEECIQNCRCDAAHCDKSRNVCVYEYKVMDTIDVGSSKQHCFPEHPGCGGGGPPPALLKYEFKAMDTVDAGSSKQHCVPEHRGCGGGGPPPALLKYEFKTMDTIDAGSSKQHCVPEHPDCGGGGPPPAFLK